MSWQVKQQQLARQLIELKQQSLYRLRRVLNSAQDVVVNVNGKQVLNFCSNDYLGLANHPKLITAFKKAANDYGVGSGSAHLVTGHKTVHHELEQQLAEFVGRPRVLLFSTGYMANLGVISALLNKKDCIFSDKLNHASLVDASKLSAAQFKRYFHNDENNLKLKLQQAQMATTKLIVSDGIFSMDGDVIALDKIIPIAQQENAVLMIDDAHGLGVTGNTGRGTLEQFNATINDVPILMATLGKAFGTFGAFIAGSEVLIETLIQQARSYIYTTALPPAIASATLASLKLITNEQWRREQLQVRIQQFKLGAQQLGLKLMPSDTAIQPLVIGSSESAMRISQSLEQQGILISAIRPPTVPANTARLRITFSANHTEQHIDTLLLALENLLPEIQQDVC
ncbi:8-amino-7-oxononanoate synthase [hydrothermal vent metagenome]|uniref:8-amino-7-oxononanoate synthase n=1 Tax=hydrothermal vent metagenome TaxID=652676 RepID=A0A3B1ATU1_9ZZZZ